MKSSLSFMVQHVSHQAFLDPPKYLYLPSISSSSGSTGQSVFSTYSLSQSLILSLQLIKKQMTLFRCPPTIAFIWSHCYHPGCGFCPLNFVSPTSPQFPARWLFSSFLIVHPNNSDQISLFIWTLTACVAFLTSLVIKTVSCRVIFSSMCILSSRLNYKQYDLKAYVIFVCLRVSANSMHHIVA